MTSDSASEQSASRQPAHQLIFTTARLSAPLWLLTMHLWRSLVYSEHNWDDRSIVGKHVRDVHKWIRLRIGLIN